MSFKDSFILNSMDEIERKLKDLNYPTAKNDAFFRWDELMKFLYDMLGDTWDRAIAFHDNELDPYNKINRYGDYD